MSRPCHGIVSLKETSISVAPQDVEMEDLNFYYASYSRQVVTISICSRATFPLNSNNRLAYTTMS